MIEEIVEADAERDTAAALKLWVVLSRAARAVSEHSTRDIARHGLGPTEFAVLEALYHKGPLPLGEIGERILLTSGSMTYVVDKLERRGLLKREGDPTDRRVCVAVLTEEGRSRMHAIFPAHAEAMRRALSGLDTDAKERLIAELKQLGMHARDQL